MTLSCLKFTPQNPGIYTLDSNLFPSRNSIPPYENEPTSQLASVTRSDRNARFADEESLDSDPEAHDSIGLIEDHHTTVYAFLTGHTLPLKFVPDAGASGRTVGFIISEYEQLFECVFFKPTEAQMQLIRNGFVTRILSSAVVHWSSLIGAKMFCSLRRDPDRATTRGYIPWLDRLGRICLTLNDAANLDGLNERLLGLLELVFLRFITSDTKAGYTLLRRTAFLFTQIAGADPTLWPRDPTSNGIFLAHALLPPRHEIGRFIFMDNIFNHSFGLPPLVEYDTSHPVIQSASSYPTEWVHGCPTRFMFSIVRINQWRARHKEQIDSPWNEIEEDTWAWRPTGVSSSSSKSQGSITQVAVHEGWRYALLIYLYMGMCGVNSHGPRVQSSVRQISRLYSAVKPESGGGMHFTAPVQIAAVCTQREVDRARFRALISQPMHNKMWLLRSMNFAGVLDYLWQGVAANGGPVTWEDYVTARRVVIDVGA
ncbi:Fungal specific transcription factor domain [Ceratobasidium sp. AG-Ba]|nr:Fungal specific transcription factor domain [Ceratobasidium sp. AG-Ba]